MTCKRGGFHALVQLVWLLAGQFVQLVRMDDVEEVLQEQDDIPCRGKVGLNAGIDWVVIGVECITEILLGVLFGVTEYWAAPLPLLFRPLVVASLLFFTDCTFWTTGWFCTVWVSEYSDSDWPGVFDNSTVTELSEAVDCSRKSVLISLGHCSI